MSTPITPIPDGQVPEIKQEVAREGYIHRALVALDIFCNVVLLRGQEDETISSHAARAALAGKRWGIWMSRFLDLFQADHGAEAIIGDEQRAENIDRIEKEAGQ